MNRTWRRACILFTSLIILSDARAGGLSTSFVDVFVKDVPLGEGKRVENQKGESLLLWNTGDTPLIIHVAALRPDAHELKAPAEAIEDPNWVIIRPSTLTIVPHGEGQCDIVLSLPAKKQLRHRLFQVMIWSRSDPVETKGVSFTGGLKSRLRFQTER